MTLKLLSTRTGALIQRSIAGLNPQSVAYGALTALIALLSLVFAALTYFKDLGDPRAALVARGIQWSQGTFLEAIRAGDAKTVKLFVEGGMNPNLRAPDRQLPIFLSQNQTNPAEVLKLLMKFGFDPNGPYRGGTGTNYPLFWAVSASNLELVAALLEAGARVDQAFGGVTTHGDPDETAISLAAKEAQAKQSSASAAIYERVLQQSRVH